MHDSRADGGLFGWKVDSAGIDLTDTPSSLLPGFKSMKDTLACGMRCDFFSGSGGDGINYIGLIMCNIYDW